MMDYGEEARKILERNNYYGHVCLTAAVATALQAAAEDGKKKLAEMTHIRDFAIRCLIKATGATKEQVQAAP